MNNEMQETETTYIDRPTSMIGTRDHGIAGLIRNSATRNSAWTGNTTSSAFMPYLRSTQPEIRLETKHMTPYTIRVMLAPTASMPSTSSRYGVMYP